MLDNRLSLPDLTGVNRGIRVLVVEDDGIYAEAIFDLLEEDVRVLGVTVARDGEEAIKALSDTEWPDLIITDLSMPRLGGVELLDRFRQIEKERRQAMQAASVFEPTPSDNALTPVVALTSSDRALDFLAVVEAAGNSFVTKPGDAAALRKLLRTLVRAVIWANPLPSIMTPETVVSPRESLVAT